MSIRPALVIAAQTFTEARRNRIFYSLFLFALVVILNSVIFTEVTIVTMDRMLKDTGIAAINVFALALTVFVGVGVINREVDRRSIYTVVTKPIGRHHFIVGKYLGLLAIIITTSGAMLVGLLITMVGYKIPITAPVFIGWAGILLEACVLGAFAVLCSSFTNSIVSAFMTVAIFVSGHLSGELLLAARKTQDATAEAIGSAIYYLVPNLDRFNFKYYVTYDLLVPGQKVMSSALYAGAYVAAFLLASVAVFSRRDFR
ncbi:MAG: ABC transporter permease [Myxococcales bacterium]